MDQPAPSGRRTPNRELWLLLGLCVFGWLLYLTLAAPPSAGGLPPARPTAGPSLGKADFDWNLVDLDGKPVSLSQFQHKAVFLNLWATWCPPCVREMPSIARLAVDPRIREKGVAIVAVAAGGEDAETVRSFLASRDFKGITFLRSEGPTPPVFTTEGIPATFLIAPNGDIAGAQVGAMEWDSPEVIAFLGKLADQLPVTVEE